METFLPSRPPPGPASGVLREANPPGARPVLSVEEVFSPGALDLDLPGVDPVAVPERNDFDPFEGLGPEPAAFPAPRSSPGSWAGEPETRPDPSDFDPWNSPPPGPGTAPVPEGIPETDPGSESGWDGPPEPAASPVAADPDPYPEPEPEPDAGPGDDLASLFARPQRSSVAVPGLDAAGFGEGPGDEVPPEPESFPGPAPAFDPAPGLQGDVSAALADEFDPFAGIEEEAPPTPSPEPPSDGIDLGALVRAPSRPRAEEEEEEGVMTSICLPSQVHGARGEAPPAPHRADPDDVGDLPPGWEDEPVREPVPEVQAAGADLAAAEDPGDLLERLFSDREEGPDEAKGAVRETPWLQRFHGLFAPVREEAADLPPGRLTQLVAAALSEVRKKRG